jgi:hypothetical protein
MADLDSFSFELTQRRFGDVDESFAHDEGEGDRFARLLEGGAYAR